MAILNDILNILTIIFAVVILKEIGRGQADKQQTSNRCHAKKKQNKSKTKTKVENENSSQN